MNNKRIITSFNRAPDGWKQDLSLSEYNSLDSERRKYYAPLYAKYRTKKIRDYDPDYGNFVGWKPIQVGIGNPIGYEHVGYFAAKMIDSVNNSNVLMSRILNKRDR